MSRTNRSRRFVLVLLAVLGAALAALHLRYPLPYIFTVLVYQDSDFSDIHRFPAAPIAASSSPRELLEAPHESAARVAHALEHHPDIDDLDSFLEETETSAFLVVDGGRIVLERYLLGHDEHSPQNTFSVSKSVASALVGLAIADGNLGLTDSITRSIPELRGRDERFADITIEHLIDMRSGIRYSSDAAFPFVNADDPLIYYHPDLETIVRERTHVATEPGTFQYNNYNPPLVGLALRRTSGRTVAATLEIDLWQPLGAGGEAGWTVDKHGFERMESGFYARARDLARFGQLYLQNGKIDGRRILPEAWVLQSTQLSEPASLDEYNGRTWGYRAGWWIVPRPTGRADFTAIGRYGQFIYVSPQYGVVFIRNGPGRGDWGDRDWTELFYSTAERLGAAALAGGVQPVGSREHGV